MGCGNSKNDIEIESTIKLKCHKQIQIERTYKIVVIGDTAVGKTSFLNKYCYPERSEKYPPTLTNSLYSANYRGANGLYKLMFWDTAGSERFRSLTSQFYRNADGILILFNFEDEKTLDNAIQYWHNEVKFHNPNTPVILVGHKSDTIGKVNVNSLHVMADDGYAASVAKELGIDYMKTTIYDVNTVKKVIDKLVITMIINKEMMNCNGTNLNIQEELNAIINRSSIVV
ncbi:GTP ras-related protein Rab1 [Orpheovirus IHUMI-LCC2]|uniref:GTP ras-related protein Rab1 n=1 Tax=Orpheovirus IHUMI-LCC2 TaxID=2023057 RepID=A0A2I2L4T3_9VIRU|nr:GTP ras-related protein Rab1 [Orpheovirus IHUMI-LCC2]SNW62543.1 GTP ras-related protein Rab1 [Orpheovirus IHUMI-LCC2]